MIVISQSAKKRGLALLILAGVLAIAWILVLRPLADIATGESEEGEHSLMLLSRYKALEDARPQVEAELRAMQQRNAAMSGLVEGNSAALAAAAVQSDIKAIVESNGGSVLSTQNMPSKVADGFEKIEIEYDLSLPLSSLKNVIYQIETHTPYLFIDDVTIRMPEGWMPESVDTPAPALEVQWLIRGYRWVGAK